MTRLSNKKLVIGLITLLIIAGAGFGVARWRRLGIDHEATQPTIEEPESVVDVPEDVIKLPSATTMPDPTTVEDENAMETQQDVVAISADDVVIIAELSSGASKTLNLERVNDWLHEDTFIEQTFDYFCGAELSPNGQEILLGIKRPPTGLATSLMVIWNVSENALLLLSADGCGGVWSPNSRYIAYDGGEGAGVRILVVIDVTTRKQVFAGLTNTFLNTYFSHWSSDSTQLYFRKPVELETLRSDNDPLWVINVDGTGIMQVE